MTVTDISIDRNGDRTLQLRRADLAAPEGGGDRIDDPAFDALYAERYRTMVNLASSMVDQRSEAEEIVQEAFQQVWLRWDRLEQPRTYLRAIVVNRCHDTLRRRRLRRRLPEVLPPRVEPESHYLADALGSVQPRRREALVLRFYGGHSIPEVARAMGIPTGTAKSLIHRGLADLRGALVDEETILARSA